MEKRDKVVYLHRDKSNTVRYVGSGSLYRANATYAKSKRGKRYAEYVNVNGKLEVEIVADCLSKLEAEDLERELYNRYQDSILNMSIPKSDIPMYKEMFYDYLYYDETSTTCLRWKVSLTTWMKIGSEAGGLDKTEGYYRVVLKGVRYKVHRIIAVLHDLDVNGFVIDHIDRNRSNNKISNLRVVNHKENCQNKNIRSNNTSGIEGVYYHKGGYWVASWCEEGNRKNKYFRISKYLSSEIAFKAAYEYRQMMVGVNYK